LLLLSAPADAASLDVRIVDAAGRPLEGAVVSITPAQAKGGAPRPAGQSAMGQKNIQFTPGTLVVPVGTTVSFPNFDKVRHHVYSFSKAKKFEIQLYGREQTRSVLFDRPGTVALGCNIHDQMRGFIRVVDTNWAATSDGQGRVSFAGLPAGAAQLVIWHPGLRGRDNELRRSLSIAATAATETVQVPVAR
jgi:plastocyanin